MRRSACIAATSLLVALTACTGSEPEPGPPNDADRFESGRPFAEPSELVADGGVLETTITVSERMVDVSGFEVLGKAYDGTLMGPTLRLAPGDTLWLDLVNDLEEQFTNIHFHGLHVSPTGDSDNIFRHVMPGTTAHYEVAIPPDHEPGSYWYHSHAHGLSEEQVFAGLSGIIVIDGLTDLLPAELRGIEQRVFALKDVQVEGDRIAVQDIDSNAPTNRTVNGQVRPRIQIAPEETQLWRFANIGADIFYELAIGGIDFAVVAEDGYPVVSSFNTTTLVLPPGKRFEVLVRFPEAGSYQLETLEYHQGDDVYPREVLATVAVEGDAGGSASLPAGSTLLDSPDLRLADVAERRTVILSEDEDTNTFFIDGKTFDPERVDVSPKLGTVEEWTLGNTSDEQHPFHIHVNDFQVVQIDGQAVPWHGRQDTVILEPGRSVVIRIPFADFTGKFVFHCHILAHEDAGMMAVVDVAR